MIALLSLTSLVINPQVVQTQTVSFINPNSQTNHSHHLIWPTQGVVSQGFIKYQHEGIDIAGPIGTPIMAAAAGIVVKSGWDNWGLGNFVEIKHSDGSATVYGHNRRLLVSKGQQVKQGQIIAEMGSTGNSSGPHLHFEFYPDGRLAGNPLALLPSSTTVKNPQQIPQQISDNNAVTRVTPKVNQSQKSIVTTIDSNMTNKNLECIGNTLITGETTKATIKVCQEQGKLFYIGQLKENSSDFLKLPAYQVSDNKYRADNGSFSYFVTPKKVEVWRYGIPISTNNFHD